MDLVKTVIGIDCWGTFGVKEIRKLSNIETQILRKKLFLQHKQISTQIEI